MSFRKILEITCFWAVCIGTLALIFSWMAKADLRSSFAPYETPGGLLTGTRAPAHPSGNSLLYTSEKWLVLTLSGTPNPSPLHNDVGDFGHTIATCEAEPGLYRRAPFPEPFSTDQESQDDYIGIIAASYRMHTHQAWKIHDYGQQHFYRGFPVLDFPYYYSTGSGDDDFSAWLGRFPAFHAHLEWGAQVQPNLMEVVAWSITVATAGAFQGDAQDPWILTWLMIDTMDGRSWLGRAATQVWVWRLKRHWPGGMGQVFARYFNDPEHPLAKALQGSFEPSWWHRKN